MLRAYKTEIHPTEEQKKKINQGIGICRWLYNQYLATNQELYKQFQDGLISKKEATLSANNFDKYINNEIKILEGYKWINLCGSKARKKAICNAESAYKRFFKGQSKFPRFKKKNKSDVKLYFPKNNKTDWKTERHKINIPTLKWVRLKEFGYIPTNAKVVNGTISKKADRYFVSVVIEEEHKSEDRPYTKGIGIDLGIKEFAVISNGTHKKNINKTVRVKKLQKKLKREQRRLSRKYESFKLKNKNKKGKATRQNIQKQIVKVQRVHQRLSNIRTDYINKTINKIVKQKPSYITIEDLNVSGMMKNKHLSKAVAQQKFYEFRVKLEYKCNLNEIELRIVDRFYPSSKTCSCCGAYKKDLKLSDRVYKCNECNSSIDRDYNASINLENAKIYKVA
ncbi:transposase [Clostridium sp. ZBS15]|uniref:RNA-guided endonuclease InsQ/TnpB family protein n=1 Tax=Clostridium sp. ZBS15 TaxID=2949969 RepID=UPI00207A24F7|nr:transposase [Clostridium sp. ZBS15]